MIEQDRELSRSALWAWQREYYDGVGIETWRDGRTPHYITSNPRIARNYAEIVLAFVRDLERRGGVVADEPIHVLELGAGSGRFSFHFLHWLRLLASADGGDWTRFRYVITDAAANNVEFCREHPRLRRAFDLGVADTAVVDVVEPGVIRLDRAGTELSPGSLANPVVVIANYIFDSVPNHLFFVRDGTALLGYTTLDAPADAVGAAGHDLARVDKSLVYRPLPTGLFASALHAQLVEHYAATFEETHLLFPVAALAALEHLGALSGRGMLVLAADKGTHRLDELDHCPPPMLVPHGGAFSVNVNFHALAAHCVAHGGRALFPDDPFHYLDVGCLLYVDRPDECDDTSRAFRQQVTELGPDPAYEAIVADLQVDGGNASLRGISSLLRLGAYDSVVLDLFFPRLMELAGTAGGPERAELVGVLERVGDLHYPIGEEVSTAAQIGCLLYELDELAGALACFEQVVEQFGPNTGLLHDMALCCLGLGRNEVAAALLGIVTAHEPANRAAQALLAGIG